MSSSCSARRHAFPVLRCSAETLARWASRRAYSASCASVVLKLGRGSDRGMGGRNGWVGFFSFSRSLSCWCSLCLSLSRSLSLSDTESEGDRARARGCMGTGEGDRNRLLACASSLGDSFLTSRLGEGALRLHSTFSSRSSSFLTWERGDDVGCSSG